MRETVIVAAISALLAFSPQASRGQGPVLLPFAGKHVARASNGITPTGQLPRVADTSKLMLVAPTSTGLTIVPTFDGSITGDAQVAEIENAINQAIAVFQPLFNDPITVQIYFRYATTDADNTTPLGARSLAQSSFVIYNAPWSTYVTALQADAKTSNDSAALANLPSSPQTANVFVSSANGRAVNLNTPPGMNTTGHVGTGPGFVYDGIVTLNSAVAWQFTRPTSGSNYDAQRSLEHEMDEVLGLGSFINQLSNYRPQDLFSFSASGARSVLTTGTRYFSIDGGATDIVGFNQDSNGDFGDWLSGTCPQSFPYVQNAFSCSGQFSDVSANSPEGINLDVIGYDLNSSSSPQSCTANATTLCLSNNRFAVSTTWRHPDGTSGQGQAQTITGDTGWFWFDNPSSVEIVVKALNGCGVNSHQWVFAGGLTNVNVVLTVIDTQTGAVKSYTNPLNTAFLPIQDTSAFSTCP